MTRSLFLKMCILGLLSIVGSPQKGEASVNATQSLEDVWCETWADIDVVLTRLINRVSQEVDNLYVEKGNFATRDCPINAYLVLANPVHGDIAQMEATDMVSIDINFCAKKNSITVVATVSKGTVISQLEQGPLPLDQGYQKLKEDIQKVLVRINNLVDQSSEKVQELLM